MKTVKDEGIKNNYLEGNVSIKKAEIEEAIGYILKQLDLYMDDFIECYPKASSENLIYKKTDNSCWTGSFYTAMLWLAYEVTEDKKYKDVAEIHLKHMEKRIKDKYAIDTHDLGFLYTLSCVAGYKITGDEAAKRTALEAADLLMERYHDKAKIIQAWGDLNDPSQRGRMIIDCNLNLPLLYWAYEVSGNKKYFDVAVSHAKQAAKHIVREDASTYHTYFMDVSTGDPIKGITHQGYSDKSCWSRGQAWGIYGFILSYRYTNESVFMELSKKLCNYFLNRLPEDFIAYWDLVFTSGEEQERDSSASTISACGMLEMIKYMPISDSNRKQYEAASVKILKSIIDSYTTKGKQSNGIVMHAVYAKPQENGIDECCLWGDYYYFEALVRMYKDWNLYW